MNVVVGMFVILGSIELLAGYAYAVIAEVRVAAVADHDCFASQGNRWRAHRAGDGSQLTLAFEGIIQSSGRFGALIVGQNLYFPQDTTTDSLFPMPGT
jgi:hypothetical protein